MPSITQLIAGLRGLGALALCLCCEAAMARQMLDPGDSQLRHDLHFLEQRGHVSIPITTWPIPWRDVEIELTGISTDDLTTREYAAAERLLRRARRDLAQRRLNVSARISASSNPDLVQRFHTTPRSDLVTSGAIEWHGSSANVRLQGNLHRGSSGGRFHPDGTYIGRKFGNWLVSAGWERNWWGSGADGSLILSTNARPFPAVSLRRAQSRPFANALLAPLGPWTLSLITGLLDDARVVTDARIFAIRGAFRPLDNLEIGISRSAQWCGDDRPCGFSTFTDLLLGRDNRGVNVDAKDEPGNQLGGVDLRWSRPFSIPISVYAQWIAEDTRRGGPAPGSWLRQVGIEFFHGVGAASAQTHIEVSDTSCRMGGLGFSEISPDCGYEHSIYRSGYRYEGRSIGHGLDGDGISYSVGTTLVQSVGLTWGVSARYMRVNRAGNASDTHSLSADGQDILSFQLLHSREIGKGEVRLGFGYQSSRQMVSGTKAGNLNWFIEWGSK